MRQELTAIHTDDRLAVLLVGVTEALIDELLRGEGLDDTQPAECLLDLTDELPPLVLRLEAGALERLPYAPHDEARDGQDEEDEEGELPADDEHRAEVDEDEDRVLQKEIERTHHGVLHLPDVPRDTSQHVTLALFAEEAQRQSQDLCIELIAQVTDDPRADRHEEEAPEVGSTDLQERHQHQIDTEDDERVGGSLGLDKLGDEVAEVIRHHLLHLRPTRLGGEVKRAEGDISRHPLLDLEEDIEDGHHKGEGHQIEQSAQDVEEHRKAQVPLIIRSDEAADQHEYIFHLCILGLAHRGLLLGLASVRRLLIQM